MANSSHGRRSRLLLDYPSSPEKAGPVPTENVLHTYRVELFLEAPGLTFVALVEAPHTDVAAKGAGLRVAEVIKEGHFITRINVSLVDDEPSLPVQRREDGSC
ncbi:hypothetical protein [Amycolatopsis minnesotensis]|uniref:DUF35 domain-containing protein n=1 Tax=Amycolatopsis minnesotensis TaxID=337894 RepID=A0ABP5CDI6_9PSEU